MITVNTTEPKEKLEEEVNDDLRFFEEWFKAQGNAPLVHSEVAILKTWIWWHLNVGLKKSSTP